MINSCFAQKWVNVTSDYINNPSFEDYNTCPQNTSDPSNYWIDSCLYWSHGTYASPDYLNSCTNSLNPIVGIPYSYTMGRQFPYHGNAYIGFYAYALPNFHLWCEYVQSETIRTLESGKNINLQ